ncbi:MAG: hypothetical protein M1817_001101 [Caeruleum heppii]|nr:MAG: hypothetical protein M1817_001101 [Caeruleum heppii]
MDRNDSFQTTEADFRLEDDLPRAHVGQANYDRTRWQEPRTEQQSMSNIKIVRRDSSSKTGTAIQQLNPNSLNPNAFADFFSTAVFQTVLHNPVTAHRLHKFSQSRFCGENMEFLEQLDRYNSLVDELTKLMADIHRTYTSQDAPRQLNISPNMIRKVGADVRTCISSTLPAVDGVFVGAQQQVEKLLATDIYPRFVKHQMTKSARQALSEDREKYQGLGDCFCLTDPAKGDNPIVFASDGFIAVTGYTRADIIPRNCRFLQGGYTDRVAIRRLKGSIDAQKEVVEFLLNYRKNGEPFWNLLYIAPLYHADGTLAFYFGAQINCSTTIHNSSDILRILSLADETEEEASEEVAPPPTPPAPKSGPRKFFKAFRSGSHHKDPAPQRETGMEQQLLKQIGKVNFSTQMRMFYTAYSKYMVLSADSLRIQFHSAGVVDELCLDVASSAQLADRDVFKVLKERAPAMPSNFKVNIKDALARGKSISADLLLSTPWSVTKKKSGERFATHWTPLKDEHSVVGYIILTLSSTSQG